LPGGIALGQCPVNKRWKLFDLISGRNETAKIARSLEGLWRRCLIVLFLAALLYVIKVLMIGMLFRFRNLFDFDFYSTSDFDFTFDFTVDFDFDFDVNFTFDFTFDSDFDFTFDFDFHFHFDFDFDFNFAFDFTFDFDFNFDFTLIGAE
jgi:hypothetical protein